MYSLVFSLSRRTTTTTNRYECVQRGDHVRDWRSGFVHPGGRAGRFLRHHIDLYRLLHHWHPLPRLRSQGNTRWPTSFFFFLFFLLQMLCVGLAQRIPPSHPIHPRSSYTLYPFLSVPLSFSPACPQGLSSMSDSSSNGSTDRKQSLIV